MNVALPALIVFVLLLPGFIFRSRFKRVERTSIDFAPFGVVATEAVLLAALLHALWMAGAILFFNEHVSVEAILELAGSDPKGQLAAATVVSASQLRISAYFGSLLSFCFVAPPLARLAISTAKWDRNNAPLSRFLRFHQAPWYYLLTGADFPKGDEPDMIVVSAIVDTSGEQPMLYTGVLDDYFVTPEGDLDRLVLSDVFRRPFGSDRKDPTNPERERFYPIDGDYFVLRYSEIITLNIKYIGLPEPAGAAT